MSEALILSEGAFSIFASNVINSLWLPNIPLQRQSVAELCFGLFESYPKSLPISLSP